MNVKHGHNWPGGETLEGSRTTELIPAANDGILMGFLDDTLPHSGWPYVISEDGNYMLKGTFVQEDIPFIATGRVVDVSPCRIPPDEVTKIQAPKTVRHDEPVDVSGTDYL